MFQPVSLFIGLRYSRSRSRTGFVSFITFFSIVGILLGVAALITVVSVMNGFEGDLKKRILGIVPHIVVSKQNTEQDLQNWQQLQKQLLALPEVDYVTPIVESEALVIANNQLQGVLMQGLMPEHEQHNLINTHMVTGQLQGLNEKDYHLIMGASLARKLHLRIGDQVKLALPNKTTFTPMGRIPMQRSFTLVGLFDLRSQVDDSVVYIHNVHANKLLRKQQGVSQLRLYLSDAFLASQVMTNISQQLPKLQVTSWHNSQGTLFSAVKMEKKMMWLMLALIIAVAAFNVVSALVMMVIDKQGEIAILQTFGMDRAGIMKIFISQGVINGFWGAALGTITGVLLSSNLNELLSFLGLSIIGAGSIEQNLPVQLTLRDVALVPLLAMLMSFLATLYPAYRASNTQPAEVLCNE